MVQVTKAVSSDAVRQNARHTLFVEGENPNGFDVPVLDTLLRGIIKVRPLGASFSVKSVAEALHPFHPDYYFLVDRDHQDDTVVDQSWRNFPDPNTQNLLVWSRRELESYFIVASYLARLEDKQDADIYRIKSESEIAEIVRETCARRLYLDAVNQVIAEVREQNKAKWIPFFKNPSDIPDSRTARRKLVQHSAFNAKLKAFQDLIDSENLKSRFDEILDEMTDGVDTLRIGKGNWLERIRAKKVWPTVVSKCFVVKDRNGKEVRGSEKNKQVALALTRKSLDLQPADFRELHRLILSRVESR